MAALFYQIFSSLALLVQGLYHLISSDSDPLVKGRSAVHLFTSLQSAAMLFAFLLLALALLISDATLVLPLPLDLFFAITAVLFYLEYSLSSSSSSSALQTSDLPAPNSPYV